MNKILDSLRDLLQKTANREMRTPKDFDFLELSIYERTHEMVNTSTLKRFYGYVGEVVCPRESTLDILCRYVGYTNFKAFAASLKGEGESESNLVVGDHLYSEELRTGERVRVLWQPDREIVVRYEGSEQFIVETAVNSKLRVGCTFRCPLFIQHEPLYLTAVTGLAAAPSDFVCGSTKGITFVVLDEAIS